MLWKGREGAQSALSDLLTAEEQLMPRKSGKPGVFCQDFLVKFYKLRTITKGVFLISIFNTSFV